MKELLKVAELKSIRYCSTLLSSDSQVLELSTAELSKKLGFEYTETLYLEGNIDPKTLIQHESKMLDKPSKEKIEERLKTPLEGLVICKMPDPVGHGLFTQNPIANGTVIAFYSGVLSEIDEKDDYAAGFYSLPENLQRVPAITAKKYGGIARFMQHLPFDSEQYAKHMVTVLPAAMAAKTGVPIDTIRALIARKGISLHEFALEMAAMTPTKELNTVSFCGKDARANLASANVALVKVIYNEMLIFAICAVRDIPAYSQIGFSYGDELWAMKKTKPLYFNQKGKILAFPEIKYLHTPDETTKLNQATKLYAKGVIEYNNKSLSSAENLILDAQKIFIETVSYYSPENGKACSTLASIYRDQNEIDKAIHWCIQAILIKECIQESTDQMYKKLKSCLIKDLNTSPDPLKSKATELFKEGHIELAKTLFLYLFSQLPETDTSKSTCAYNLARCHEQQNDMENARKYYQAALEMPHCKSDLRDKINAKMDSSEKSKKPVVK